MERMKNWDVDYWQQRWEDRQTGWDIGYPSPPLVDYVKQRYDKSIRTLIPGCGNAYEAEELYRSGFINTYVVDIAPGAFDSFKKRFPDFPEENMILGDFFDLRGPYDLILEQTFFCALDPSLRRDYALKMHELLVPGGKLAGVLFDDLLFQDHPPFGGTKEEYLTYFEDLFEIETFETAFNSIGPRAGREFFIKMRKPLQD
jgi:SAM-dependent methyltransferase